MSEPSQYPPYMALAESGELTRRADALRGVIESCTLCPRLCRVNRREDQLGFCRAGERASVASCNAHHGEEPPISGSRGSGTVFFANCTMRCIYCQNYPISQMGHGREVSDAELADRFMELQKRRCHNINFVTPTHYTHAIVSALELAVRKGFRLPIVYNTSGYERVETLRLLDGVVDIYMPDIKYLNPATARAYSDAPDYPEANLSALKEMHRQVGDLEVGEDGLARRGLLVRHLVLPGSEDDSIPLLDRLRQEISPRTCVSLMSQYFPAWRAVDREPLSGRVDPEKYEDICEWVEATDLRGWTQPL